MNPPIDWEPPHGTRSAQGAATAVTVVLACLYLLTGAVGCLLLAPVVPDARELMSAMTRAGIPFPTYGALAVLLVLLGALAVVRAILRSKACAGWTTVVDRVRPHYLAVHGDGLLPRPEVQGSPLRVQYVRVVTAAVRRQPLPELGGSAAVGFAFAFLGLVGGIIAVVSGMPGPGVLSWALMSLAAVAFGVVALVGALARTEMPYPESGVVVKGSTADGPIPIYS